MKENSSRELIRYERGPDTRTYELRLAPGGAELWRVMETPGEPARVLKEGDVESTLEQVIGIERTENALGHHALALRLSADEEHTDCLPQSVPSSTMPHFAG